MLKVFAIIMALLVSQSSLASLDQAKSKFTKNFRVSPSDKFVDSPFEYTYLVVNGRKLTMFDLDLNILGYQQDWYMRENERDDHAPINVSQAESLKRILRQNIKPGWMVNAGYGAGGIKIVVISAPNCPSCRQMEADMFKHSKNIQASIYIIPTLLGRGTQSYQNAVMCSSDPDQEWRKSWKTNTYPQSAVRCEKSLWAEVVIDNAFPVENGSIRVKTPAMILDDGSVVTGWKPNSSLEDIRKKLALD